MLRNLRCVVTILTYTAAGILDVTSCRHLAQVRCAQLMAGLTCICRGSWSLSQFEPFFMGALQQLL